MHANESHVHSSALPEDADVYAALIDQLCECGLNDADYGPPETWGLWADRDVYVLGPEPKFDPLPGEVDQKNPF